MIDKTPPQVPEIEQAVLGAMMLESEAVRTALNILSSDDFYKESHRKIFTVISDLYSEDINVDILIVSEELKKRDLLDKVGGSYYLTECIDKVTTGASAEYHSRIIKEKARLRNIIKIGTEIVALAYDDKVDIMGANKISNVMRIDAGIARKEPYGLDTLMTDITKTPEGLITGYDELDDIIRIPQEAITIIAGRPSHGKTTFLLNLFLNMIKEYDNKSFFFFSYEESKRQLGLKVLNILGQETIDEKFNLINLENYLRGNNTSNIKIEGAKKEFDELTKDKRLWIFDESLNVNELRNILIALNGEYDIGAVFIDYIQKVKIKEKFGTRQIEIQKISEVILETAKSLSLPVIMGAQLGRDKDHKDKIRLDNLREAGDIEQDANLVIGIHNKAMETAQDSGEELTPGEIDIKLTILKNKNGIVNKSIVLGFDRPIFTIKSKESPIKNDTFRGS